MSSSAATRAKYRQLGLCTECGNPAREGKTTCADCAAKYGVAQRRRFVERNGREPATDYKLKTEYIFTAWNGRHIVKRGTAREVGEFFGMSASAVHEYARRGIRRRKDGVFFEREKI